MRRFVLCFLLIKLQKARIFLLILVYRIILSSSNPFERVLFFLLLRAYRKGLVLVECPFFFLEEPPQR